jgi:hypothetical protein
MADEDIREGDPDLPRKKKPLPDDDDDDRPRKRKRRDDDDDDDDRPHRSVRRKSADDGGVSSVIPYRNGPALIGYYCGVFGLISCFLGPLAIFGAVPLILGILGLKKASEDPEARGRAHAWIGIVLGALELLVGCGVSGFFGYAIVKGK